MSILFLLTILCITSSASLINTMEELGFPKTSTLPTIFLSHAAPVVIMGKHESFLGKKNTAHINSPIADWYRGLPQQLGLVNENAPKAIIQFSAHLEAYNKVIITSSDVYESLLYDYYGFPAHLYEVKYPAPGHSKLANHIKSMLSVKLPDSLPVALDSKRGIDHGGFIPLLLAYPEANIPVIQISVNPVASINRMIGEILAPLRDHGILLMGSGQLTHGGFRATPQQYKAQWPFIDAVTDGMKNGNSIDETYQKRANTVDNWKILPKASEAHMDYDHFVPLASVVGTTKGYDDKMTIIGDYHLLDIHSLRSFAFGEYPYVNHLAQNAEKYVEKAENQQKSAQEEPKDEL